MKITKSQLATFIKESVKNVIKENENQKAMQALMQALKANPKAAQKLAAMKPQVIQNELEDLKQSNDQVNEIFDNLKKHVDKGRAMAGAGMSVVAGMSAGGLADMHGWAELINNLTGVPHGGGLMELSPEKIAVLVGAAMAAGFTGLVLQDAAKKAQQEVDKYNKDTRDESNRQIDRIDRIDNPHKYK